MANVMVDAPGMTSNKLAEAILEKTTDIVEISSILKNTHAKLTNKNTQHPAMDFCNRFM